MVKSKIYEFEDCTLNKNLNSCFVGLTLSILYGESESAQIDLVTE